MSKPFKDTGLGKFLWNIGDTFKGNTKTGQVLDAALEVLPVPNPIRFAREAEQQSKLKRLQQSAAAQHVAQEAGVELNELIDESPNWVRPALACVALIGLLVLVGMEIIEPALLIQAIQAIFAN